jgi:hypothetical protein
MALLQNRQILAHTLDELEYTTSGTIRTILDSTFNQKVALTLGRLVFPTTFPVPVPGFNYLTRAKKAITRL